MLRTPHVFLDTEVFVGKNFHYKHRDFEALLEHAKAGTITLYLTDVHYREIHKKVRDRVADAKHALEPVRAIRTRPNALILRNAQHLGFGGLFSFDEGAIAAELLTQFERFVQDGNVQVVPLADLPIGPVLDKYFNSEPPFEKREEKKNEFPDAFAVAVIKEWCRVGGREAYVLSGDKGFRDACAREAGVLPLASIPDLTGLIALAAPRQGEVARGWFSYSTSYIQERIAREFEQLGFVLSDQEGEVLGTTVDSNAVELGEPEFLTIDEGAAEIVVRAQVPFTAEVIYDDPDATFWVEGEKYVVDSIELAVQKTESFDVYIQLVFNPAIEAPEVGGERIAAPEEVVENVGLDISDVEVTVDEWEPGM